MLGSPPMTAEAQARRASVQKRLSALEEEIVRLRRELSTLGVDQRLPGLYLTVEVAGSTALLPVEAVLEVVRLVAIEPLPTTAPHVRGTMLYRGSPAVVVDLAALLGVRREPELDAHLVICGGARLVAVLVDRVRDLIESPVLVEGSGSGESALEWDRTGLLAGLCRTAEGVRPLLRTSALLSVPEGT
ncbi:chemotaxis protein CheW [Archangium primigenium]|uniref:chemotaxis protein CheW n=1 Tax=[Archangium] primigenium TaxID=2792470 RepID=UPI00195D2F19|nr:chemotaxis protein CheW [Archangium primigenium]MBM7115014.1 chemotaxis protein CheW [Archangium primigenium]